MSQEIRIIIDSDKPIVCENCSNSIHMKDKSTDDCCNTIIISNRTDSSNVMLPASTINGEGRNPVTVISSLEDADIFVNEHIGSDGTFNCYLGEEIAINDNKYNAVWQIVGVDTELGKGDTPLIKHHITLVPKNNLCTSVIQNDRHCNGYINSMIHTEVIPNIVSSLETVLGDHLLERRVKLTNAASLNTSPRGYMASSNGYYSVKANLMCQMQVFGSMNSIYGNAYDTGDDTEQLPGFKTDKVAKADGAWYWLRDIYGYNSRYYYFNGVCADGSLGAYYINNGIGGVRPLITIG